MFAAVRRNVRRGGRVDRHAADWIGRAPAAFFRALMIVHRRRSRTCLMLPDGGAVRTPPVEFADGVFPGGFRMEPLLLIRKNGGYPLDFLCPVRLSPGLACQTAFKRDPRSASKKDPLADMNGVCRGEPCAACGGGRAVAEEDT